MKTKPKPHAPNITGQIALCETATDNLAKAQREMAKHLEKISKALGYRRGRLR